MMSGERPIGRKPGIVPQYTNNLNYVVSEDTLDEAGRVRRNLAIAFSHFSYDITKGYLMVCDLQGVVTEDSRGKPTLLLTDPAIHCDLHLRFGKTNHGSDGTKAFFNKHVCNDFCRALRLVKGGFSE
jgi:hypothetical protein